MLIKSIVGRLIYFGREFAKRRKVTNNQIISRIPSFYQLTNSIRRHLFFVSFFYPSGRRLNIQIRLVGAFCVKTNGSHQLQFRQGNTELPRTLLWSQSYRATAHAPLQQANHQGRVCLRRTLRRGIRPRRGEFQAQQQSTGSTFSYDVIHSCSCEENMIWRWNFHELHSGLTLTWCAHDIALEKRDVMSRHR